MTKNERIAEAEIAMLSC